jgi:hypothetical protein
MSRFDVTGIVRSRIAPLLLNKLPGVRREGCLGGLTAFLESVKQVAVQRLREAMRHTRWSMIAAIDGRVRGKIGRIA